MMTISFASSISNVPSIATQLTVVEVADLTSVKQVAKEWLELATARCHTASEYIYSKPLFCSQNMLNRLDDSKWVINGIYDDVTTMHNNNTLTENTALACIDQYSNFQALAIINRSRNEIISLATNPDNIPSLFSKQRVRGAATQIILHLANITLKTGNSIQLYCLEDVQAFYNKFGFIMDEQSGSFILTAEKIKDLVSHKIPPFDQLQMEKE